jgi:acyl-CoA synthetase (AMP-forming)/AMP-acid ligase II/acyl carrier protein
MTGRNLNHQSDPPEATLMFTDTPTSGLTNVSPDNCFPMQGAGAAGLQARSLVEVFRRRAAENSDRVAFTFLPGGEVTAPEDRTYSQLDERARAIAARLQQTCRPGDRALLMYDSGLDYIAALAGCLYAGVVAIPVFPPDPLRAARTLPRLEAIVSDAQASVLLGTAADLAWAGAMLGAIPGLGQLLPSDTIELSLADAWAAPTLDRDTPAFLQYTSGSTGTPKGVLVRHGNVLANMAQMEQMIDLENAIVCTWLPAYHDMGLVGGIFQCWYSGRRNVMLSPLAFFQQPLRWLQAVAAYRATTLAAPDFAYDLCVRKIKAEDRRDLDLGSVRLALSGAEPVRRATIERFVEAFGECGIRREIFCPCYGMAEATLLVSASPRDTGPRVVNYDAAALTQNRAVAIAKAGAHARSLVSCGRPPANLRLAIVDPQTRAPLGPGDVGEIWIAGPNVAGGYWGQAEESRTRFQAVTATGEGPFLRTGDLGFIDNGELFISGRFKDLIIIRGRNFHPQDIEQSIENCHEAIKPRGSAAFSIDEGGREQLILVQEITRPKKADLDEVSRAIGGAILEAHDLAVDAVVLVRQGTIPKTTSGKIQRHACRQQYLSGELEVLHTWQTPCARPGLETYVAPRNELESHLAGMWAEILDIEQVGIFDSFFDLGGSSLLATQLMTRLADQLGAEIPLRDLFDRPTVAALAEMITAHTTQAVQRRSADAALLDYLDTVSDEDAEALLAGGPVPNVAAPRPSTTPKSHASYYSLTVPSSNGDTAGVTQH